MINKPVTSLIVVTYFSSSCHSKSWLMYSQALINSIASFQSVLFLLCSFHMHWWFCARLQSYSVLCRIQRKVFGFVFFSIPFQDCQFYQVIPHSHFFIVASIAEYFLPIDHFHKWRHTLLSLCVYVNYTYWPHFGWNILLNCAYGSEASKAY